MSRETHILDSPEDVLSTLGADGKRKWIYPTFSPGQFAKRRKVVGYLLVLLYLLLPIVHFNGSPSVLLDFINREFSFFGLVFYPTDTFLFMLLAVAFILTFVIGTALLGRVWCGWACPQTVYLEFIFRPIERLVEGKEHVRKRRDAGPLNFDKTWRKALKYVIYSSIALVLAHTFVAYFVGWSKLSFWLFDSPNEHFGFFLLMVITTALILFNFAYFREQMCTIVCPYARMQSVLLDRDSLIVSYNPERGDPRARRSKKIMREEEAGKIEAKGDCIDCFACVRTCPTGIDIRDGLQMECIACTQCIDACDSIMDKIEKPRGLISYTSENKMAGNPQRLLRPRTLAYSILLISVFGIFILGLSTRNDLDVDLGRVQGAAPFVEMPDGNISNRIRFRLRNQLADNTKVSISVLEPENVELRFVGVHPVELKAGEQKRIETWVVIPAELFREGRKLNAVFNLENSEGGIVHREISLLGPSN